MEVERWQIQGPVPAAGAGYEPQNGFDQRLKRMVDQQGGRLVLSPALACAGREAARFFTEHGAYPTDGVQRYLAARCGSTAARPRIVVLGGAVPDSATDEQIERDYATNFDELLAHLPKGLAEVGLGFARGKGNATVVMYFAEQEARLDGFSPLLTSDTAVLEGEAPADAVFGVAMVNQGEEGVAYCDSDRAMKAPRFRFSCPVLPSDQVTRIEIATRKANQVLLRPVLAVMVRRSDEAGLVYEPVIHGGSEVASDAKQFQLRMLDALNAIRKKGGLFPVKLDASQSQANSRLAPHMFDAAFSGDDETMQVVALGLLAGWDVQGMIRDGGIYSGYLSSSRSPGRWLSYALESPLARSVLFEPDIARVAIGASDFGGSGVLGIITTYAFFDSHDHSADESAVFEELKRVRAARNLPAPKRVAKPPALKRALASIASNESTTSAAFQGAVQEVSLERQRSIGGWIVETSDIKQLIWSDDLLEAAALEVSIGVTHYKAPGAAWGQYVVLILAGEDASPQKQEASRKAPIAARAPSSRSVF